ncbi:hypothetical protein [Halobacillus litoralis]|uniref:hypothetical protein n=1 Tax=Halobacillus litoralis TaxID=45668 RepID=UPI001CFD69D0|nr:hypothetical protein [Halobacillus litoralis]
MKRWLSLVLVVFTLVGCNEGQFIQKEEAERIAIQEAEEKGYHNPELWTAFGNQTTLVYQYSVEDQQDVKAWKVELTSDEKKRKDSPVVMYLIKETGGAVIKEIGIDVEEKEKPKKPSSD